LNNILKNTEIWSDFLNQDGNQLFLGVFFAGALSFSESDPVSYGSCSSTNL